jgi:hypothetical protein
MIKKILLFWMWKQWLKYYNYFKKEWYSIYWVTESWTNKINHSLSGLFSFNNLNKKEKDFFNDFEYIVVCVKPIENQTLVINFLLDLWLTNKIIVEKPITNDINLFEKIISNKNITFFLDEVYFSRLFLNKEISNITIKASNNDYEFIEHSIWFFLLRSDFENILKIIEIKNSSEIIKDDYFNMYYEIKFSWFNKEKSK